MSTGFKEYSEAMWSAWLHGWRPSAHQKTAEIFDLEAMPEPYLLFGNQENPLTVLTTNPGQTMERQKYTSISSGEGLVKPGGSYEKAAGVLGNYYKNNLTGQAKRRIDAQIDLAHEAGYSGVMQVECLPWHSKSLPDKGRIVNISREDPDLADYSSEVCGFLESRPVVALSAVSSKFDLREINLNHYAWINRLIELLSFDERGFRLVPLTEKNGKVTSALFKDVHAETSKSILLVMGGNHFPSKDNRSELAKNIAL